MVQPTPAFCIQTDARTDFTSCASNIQSCSPFSDSGTQKVPPNVGVAIIKYNPNSCTSTAFLLALPIFPHFPSSVQDAGPHFAVESSWSNDGGALVFFPFLASPKSWSKSDSPGPFSLPSLANPRLHTEASWRRHSGWSRGRMHPVAGHAAAYSSLPGTYKGDLWKKGVGTW